MHYLRVGYFPHPSLRPALAAHPVLLIVFLRIHIQTSIASRMTTAIAMPSIHHHRHPSAPIALAPAPARKIQNILPGNGNPVTGKPTSSHGPVSAIRSRRERPCDACRRRKSRCVIQEGAALCVLCGFHKQACTFVQSPRPRKRKVVETDNKSSSNHAKKRYVQAHHYCALLGGCRLLCVLSVAWG